MSTGILGCTLPGRVLWGALLAFLIVGSNGCETTSADDGGPNAPVGGNTTTGYTNLGDKTDVFTDLSNINPVFDGIKDSVVVVKNDNGNITWYLRFTFDSAITHALDTVLGVQNLPYETKKLILDTYLTRYGATLDTSDKEHMTLSTTIKGRVTSDGIQEYITSGTESKPFTVIRFNAKVGDVYETKRASDGAKITRTVTYHSTTDDYDMAFWKIKVFKTEEVSVDPLVGGNAPADPLVKKVTYITNHKFGLVGIELQMIDGTTRKITVWPANF